MMKNLIIIPTLDRNVELNRCIDSVKLHSVCSDIIVAVDYDQVDKFGRVSWYNEKFEALTNNNSNPNEGFDWVNIVDEAEREDFLKEVTSCLEMCRKIDIMVNSVNDQQIHFLGYPYRITEKDHEGFLIHLFKEN